MRWVDNCLIRANDTSSEANPSFTVRMRSGAIETGENGVTVTAFARYLHRFRFWRLKMVWNFIFRSLVDYLCQILHLGPIFSCWPLTDNWKFWSEGVYARLVSSKIPPKALGERTASPRLISWGNWRSWGSLPLSPRTPSAALGLTRPPPHCFLGDVHLYVIADPSVCRWRCCTLLTGSNLSAIFCIIAWHKDSSSLY